MTPLREDNCISTFDDDFYSADARFPMNGLCNATALLVQSKVGKVGKKYFFLLFQDLKDVVRQYLNKGLFLCT